MTSALSEIQRRDTWELIFRLVRENAGTRWKSYVFAFVLLFIVSAMTAATAYLMEDVINEIFVERRRDQTFLVAGVVAAVFVVKGIAAYWNAIILARAGNGIVASLQMRMFDSLLKQDIAFFDRTPVGDLLVRFQASVRSAREAINLLVLSIGRDVFTLFSLVAVMIIQDPWMSLISLVIAPPAVLGVMHLMRKVKVVAQSEFVSLGQLMSTVTETVAGVKTVKIYRLEDRVTSVFGDSVEAVRRLMNNMNRLAALTVPMMETLGGLAVAAAILYGGLRVIDGGSEPGAFFSFITALLLAYEPARRLARFNVTFQQQMIGARLVYEIIEMTEAESEKNIGAPLDVRGGHIVFDDVSFSYQVNAENKTIALRNLNLEFPPNEVTALVGPSGGGKSTILSMINRMQQPQSGTVSIDGVDISTVSAKSLRQNIAYVTQDPFLFNLSIRDNIRFGNLEATDEEIEAAAKAAFAHDFILQQPNGYETVVGERGNRLSGGQRQRIAIARAIISDAPILLLDEATSALDSESEQKVQLALSKLMKTRTTIVIAHRLSTIRSAARIHVIEEGSCLESGTHEELVARDSLYAKLHNLQFSE